MPQLETVGSRVRWWREFRKRDRKELAKKVGMAETTLSDLENERQHGSRKLHLIAAELRLNPHYLETGKGEPEAEFQQEPPKESTPWPFESIAPQKLERLNRIERAYLEQRLQEALGDIETERRKSKKAG